MNTEELKQVVESNLDKRLMSSKILMQHFNLLTEESRKTLAYLDYKYIPFYYHLGKYIKPVNVVEFGMRLGLLSGVFFKTCTSAKHYLGFQQQGADVYSSRLALGNIRQNFKGTIDHLIGDVYGEGLEEKISGHKWDLAIVNEESGYDLQRFYLETLWNNLEMNGLLVVEYVTYHEAAGKAFMDFCKISNRPVVIAKTKYGTGLVQK